MGLSITAQRSRRRALNCCSASFLNCCSASLIQLLALLLHALCPEVLPEAVLLRMDEIRHPRILQLLAKLLVLQCLQEEETVWISAA